MVTFSINQGFTVNRLKKISELIVQMGEKANEKDLEFAAELYFNIIEGKTGRVNLKSFAAVSRKYEQQHKETEDRFVSLDGLQEKGYEQYLEDCAHPTPEGYRVSKEETEAIINGILMLRNDVLKEEGFDLVVLISKARKEIVEIEKIASKRIAEKGKRLTHLEKQKLYDSTFNDYLYGWANKQELVDDGHGGKELTRYNVYKKLEAAKRIRNAERREIEIARIMKMFPEEEKSIVIIKRIVDEYTEEYNGFSAQELITNVISNARVRDYIEEIIRFENP